MRCEKISRKILTFFDRETAESEKAAVMAHVKTCSGCADKLNEAGEFFDRIRSIPSSGAPADFTQRLTARESVAVNYRTASWMRPAIAFAAGAAAVLVITTFMRPEPSIKYVSDPQHYSFAGYSRGQHIKQSSEGYVRINLKSREHLQKVTIEIEMPEGLILADGKSSARWRGDLFEGDNVLLLKVRGRSGGAWDINGVLEFEGIRKNFSKNVRVI